MIAGSARLSLTTICTCSFQRKIDLIRNLALGFRQLMMETNATAVVPQELGADQESLASDRCYNLGGSRGRHCVAPRSAKGLGLGVPPRRAGRLPGRPIALRQEWKQALLRISREGGTILARFEAFCVSGVVPLLYPVEADESVAMALGNLDELRQTPVG